MDDSLKALEMGAVETLIVWENLDIMRYVLKNHQTDGEYSIHIAEWKETNDVNGYMYEGLSNIEQINVTRI